MLVTVIMEPAIVERTSLEPSTPICGRNPGRKDSSPLRMVSIQSVPVARTSALRTSTSGVKRKLERTASHQLNKRAFTVAVYTAGKIRGAVYHGNVASEDVTIPGRSR